MGLALVSSGGCQVYDPSLLERDGGQGSSCERLRQPAPRPAGEDATGDNGEEYVFGMRAVVLDQAGGGAWRDIGFDLDGHCTQPPDLPTECLPPRRSRPPADGNEGIDNVFGETLFPLVDIATDMTLQMTARAAQEEGRVPTLRLRGWNGMPNDSRVEVTITSSIFMVPAAADDGVPEFEVVDFEPIGPGGERLGFPRWDGTDYGFFRRDTFLDGNPDQPFISADNAYVVDNLIVAELPGLLEINFPAENAGVGVKLTDSTATARISEDGLSLTDVVVGGRWRIFDLLDTAESVGVCRGSDTYNLLTGQLDANADVRSQPGTGGEGVQCDAISVGVAFSATRMRWGGLTPGPELPNLCENPPADAGTTPDAGAPDASASAGDGG